MKAIELVESNEIRSVKNVSGVTLLPLLNTVKRIENGVVWKAIRATETTITERKMYIKF